ncbi:hypothetical protein Tco_0019539 [Tanacetum coccineum]
MRVRQSFLFMGLSHGVAVSRTPFNQNRSNLPKISRKSVFISNFLKIVKYDFGRPKAFTFKKEIRCPLDLDKLVVMDEVSNFRPLIIYRSSINALDLVQLFQKISSKWGEWLNLEDREGFLGLVPQANILNNDEVEDASDVVSRHILWRYRLKFRVSKLSNIVGKGYFESIGRGRKTPWTEFYSERFSNGVMIKEGGSILEILEKDSDPGFLDELGLTFLSFNRLNNDRSLELEFSISNEDIRTVVVGWLGVLFLRSIIGLFFSSGMALPSYVNSLCPELYSCTCLNGHVLYDAFILTGAAPSITAVNSLKSKVVLLISHCKIRGG